jgi:hypothetical protein
MRWSVVLFSFPIAAPAIAAIPPGPPPWVRMPIEACNADDTCVSFVGAPLEFSLRNIGGKQNKFVWESFARRQTTAMVFSDVERAQQAVGTDPSVANVSIILIPNDKIADSDGFWAHTVWRSNAGRFVAKEKLLISCSSVR